MVGIFSLYALPLAIAFQIYYLNQKKNNDLILRTLLISAAIFFGNYSLELVFQKNLNQHNVVYHKKQMTQEDTLFLANLLNATMRGTREISSEEKLRFRDLVQAFPMDLKKSHLSDAIRVGDPIPKAIYSDLIKSFEQGSLFISEERKSLETPLESKRNNEFILQAISGKPIRDRHGNSRLLTKESAISILNNIDEEFKRMQMRIDELYLGK
jgi:hypothetical protein